MTNVCSYISTILFVTVIATVIFVFSVSNYWNVDDFAEDYKNFLGEKWWSTEHLELCDDVTKDTLWRRNDSICLTYLHNLLPVDLEIVSWSPALVIFRNILSNSQKTRFLEYIDQQELQKQQTSDYGNSRESTHRQANGSFFAHDSADITSELHRKLATRIPGINFTSSELFSALSYLPGGHYSAHYDYLTYRSEDQWDWWIKTFRNRLATLIFVLQTAEQGGGTVFPKIGTTIRANAGDAFLWFTAGADESVEDLSLHGGCPIYAGRKVITTLWIRARNQPIPPMSSVDSPISTEWLIPGFSSQFRTGIPDQCNKS